MFDLQRENETQKEINPQVAGSDTSLLGTATVSGSNCVYTWLHGQIAGHQCRVLQNQYPHKYLGQEFQHNFSIINNSKYYH